MALEFLTIALENLKIAKRERLSRQGNEVMGTADWPTVVRREHLPARHFDRGFYCVLLSCLAVQIEPVSSMLAATESCLSPIWIK
jgi:hypothetical protein